MKHIRNIILIILLIGNICFATDSSVNFEKLKEHQKKAQTYEAYKTKFQNLLTIEKNKSPINYQQIGKLQRNITKCDKQLQIIYGKINKLDLGFSSNKNEIANKKDETKSVYISSNNQNNPIIEIEKCKTYARVQIDIYLEKAYSMIEQEFNGQIQSLNDKLKQLETLKINASMEYDPSLLGLSPSAISQITASRSSVYDGQILQIKEYLNLIEVKRYQAKNEAIRLFEQGYNKIYLDCLNNKQ